MLIANYNGSNPKKRKQLLSIAASSARPVDLST